MDTCIYKPGIWWVNEVTLCTMLSSNEVYNMCVCVCTLRIKYFFIEFIKPVHHSTTCSTFVVKHDSECVWSPAQLLSRKKFSNLFYGASAPVYSNSGVYICGIVLAIEFEWYCLMYRGCMPWPMVYFPSSWKQAIFQVYSRSIYIYIYIY